MMKKHFLILIALILFGANACRKTTRENITTPTNVAASQSNPNAPSSTPTRPKIVAFGDSLSAGFGLPESQSYPSLLQQKLDADGFNYEVINAGVSGDTTAGGLRRIDWTLDDKGGGKIDFLILELGGNDVLRGLPLSAMKKNLANIIEKAQARNVQVVLAGMYAPTSNGRDYQRGVVTAFQSLAREYNLPFIPFVLANVGGVASLNQADGIHPNVEGEKIMTDTVYKTLKPLLEQRSQQK